jgi:hypothetical protein
MGLTALAATAPLDETPIRHLAARGYDLEDNLTRHQRHLDGGYTALPDAHSKAVLTRVSG